jgi:Protein of unknown function (DUF4242)
MVRYLAELYLPKGAGSEVAATTARARAAVAAEDEHGEVRCLRSIFVPEDETWFLLYDGPTAAAVRRAVDRAGLTCARVVEAVDGSDETREERR